jgi:hypothetical protein
MIRQFLNRLLLPYKIRIVRLNGRLSELHHLLQPYNYKIQKRFLRGHGSVVSRGPFSGLQFRRDAKKLLGTYEHELHDSVEELICFKPDVILNIGSADGYYALGLAKRLPESKVFAFDLNKKFEGIISELANRNNVTVHFFARAFDKNDLTHVNGLKTAVVLDVEGAEMQVLETLGSSLNGMFLIIETHDIFVPDITKAVVSRLEATHEISEIEEATKQTDLPALSAFSCLDRALLVNEFRAGKQVWLVARPRG